MAYDLIDFKFLDFAVACDPILDLANIFLRKGKNILIFEVGQTRAK